MQTAPRFDLLPLAWWENPWIVGGLIASVIIVVLIVCAGIWFLHRRKKIEIHPLDQWLFDLYALEKLFAAQQCTVQQVYAGMILVIRSYARDYYKLGDASLTDEEFLQCLKDAGEPVPEEFLLLVCQVSDDAYQVKFANNVIPEEHVGCSLGELIVFLEQEKMG